MKCHYSVKLHVRKAFAGVRRPSQVCDDVTHAVVGEEEEFAARLRKVVDAVAGVKHLQRQLRGLVRCSVISR